MSTKRVLAHILATTAILAAPVMSAHATVFTGNLYYTLFTGGQNVWRIGFNYDDVAHNASLGSAVNIASTNGADGIIFAPNGNLLIGGQGFNNVYEVNPSNGAVVNTQALRDQSYHLALDPSGTKVYTSNFRGPLDTVNIPIGTGAALTTITGSAAGLTQVAFGNTGTVFYVDGSPNGGGNLGTINLGTGVTTQLYGGVTPAHGLIFDPFTNLITMFGAGQTGTMNATTGLGGVATSGAIYGVGDFDQGAVDGLGHALVAGSNAITFIDYSVSHDITHPDHVFNFGGFNGIDDVAPLVGPGSNPNPTPEPASLALLGLGLAGLGFSRRRKARA
jgi:hypothetical protein